MHITLELICEQLRAKFPDLQSAIPLEAKRKRYPFPVLCPEKETLSCHKLYILHESQWSGLENYSEENAVICIGSVPPDYSGAYISLPKTYSLLETYAAVCNVFASFSRLQSALEQCIHHSSSLQGLVVAAGQWTKNPVTVCDDDHIVLAHYTRDKNYQAFSSANIIGKRIPFSWIKDPYAGIRQKNEKIRIAKSTIGDRECEAYSIPVFHEDRCIADISISSYEAPLQESDRLLLTILAPFIKRALLENKTINSISLFSVQSAFRSILQDSVLNKRSIRHCLQQNEMSPVDQYLCITMQLNWTWDMKLPVDYICSEIQKRLKRGCCFKHDSNIVAFVNLDLLSATTSNVLEKIQTLLQKYNFKAGVSNVFKDVFQAEIYYTQALIALECGNIRIPKESVYHFEDFALDHFLRYGTTRLSARDICSAKILELNDCDKENGTEYINTLRALFDHDMSPTKAAQALYIHRTTFLYRLERIQSVFHIDWSDPRQRLYLMISLELL